MNIGSTPTMAPAAAAAGALKSALDTQAGLATSLINQGTGADGQAMKASAMAEQGKGQHLNSVV